MGSDLTRRVVHLQLRDGSWEILTGIPKITAAAFISRNESYGSAVSRVWCTWNNMVHHDTAPRWHRLLRPSDDFAPEQNH
jgi:hypothetical protein